MRYAAFLLMLVTISDVAEARCGRCRSGGWRRPSCQRVRAKSEAEAPVMDRSILIEHSDDRFELWVHNHGLPGPDPMLLNDTALPDTVMSVEIGLGGGCLCGRLFL